MNASFWVARSRDTYTCTDVTDTHNQWVYSVVYHIANDAWPDAHCIIALWRRIGFSMQLLVARKSLKVMLQGHFSGYPSHKTYTCQNVTQKSLMELCREMYSFLLFSGYVLGLNNRKRAAVRTPVVLATPFRCTV